LLDSIRTEVGLPGLLIWIRRSPRSYGELATRQGYPGGPDSECEFLNDFRRSGALVVATGLTGSGSSVPCTSEMLRSTTLIVIEGVDSRAAGGLLDQWSVFQVTRCWLSDEMLSDLGVRVHDDLSGAIVFCDNVNTLTMRCRY
jgi:hypothetical protein